MDFTVEMGRIAQDIRHAAEERAGTLSQIRANAGHLRAQTLSFLKEASRQHATAGAHMHRELARFMAGLQTDVNGLLRQSQGNLRGFAADFQRGGAQFRQTLRSATMPQSTQGASARTQARGEAKRPAASRRRRS